jgi:hypothetical protein
VRRRGRRARRLKEWLLLSAWSASQTAPNLAKEASWSKRALFPLYFSFILCRGAKFSAFAFVMKNTSYLYRLGEHDRDIAKRPLNGETWTRCPSLCLISQRLGKQQQLLRHQKRRFAGALRVSGLRSGLGAPDRREWPAGGVHGSDGSRARGSWTKAIVCTVSRCPH